MDQRRGQHPLAPTDVRTLRVDRRRFLQLAAASGIAAIGSGRAVTVLAQEASPGVSTSPDIIGDLAESLDRDLERIFRFVQNEVRYEPYAGILRGARGTLLARAGNSADQAMLLAELLRAAGFEARFASGPLAEGIGEALMATTVIDPGIAREMVGSGVISDADIAAGIDWGRLGIPADESAELPDLEAFRAAYQADVAALAPVASAQLRATVDTIQAALAAAGIALPTGTSPMPALELEEHRWVQVNDGSAWLDLEPTVRDVEPGETVAAPGPTVDSMPDELRHRVDLDVTAETWTGGVLATEPILGISGFADELDENGLLFLHVPTADAPTVNLIGGLSEGTQYNAVFLVGPAMFVGQRPISFGGAGGGGDLFGGALGGGGGEGLVDGETSAEWIDVSVTSPAGTTRTARRTVFDRLGPAMRASGAIDPYAVAPAELVALDPADAPDFLPARALHAFSVSTSPGNVKARIEGLGPSGLAFLSAIPSSVDASRHLIGAELATDVGVRAFNDTPAIGSWVFQPTQQGYELSLDIWHRSTGTLGMTGSTPIASPAMIAGVLPHVIERIAMGDPSGTEQPAGLPVSVGAIFEAAIAEGVPIRALSGSIPPDGILQPEHAALIGQALEAGYLVVVPERPVVVGGQPRLGWWIIDPATGMAVDQREDGGGATTERGLAEEVLAEGRALIRAFRETARRDPKLAGNPEFIKMWEKVVGEVMRRTSILR